MNRLKELRNTVVHSGRKLRQADIAELVGVTKLTVSNWESGKHEIKADKAKELADFFGVSISVLLGYRSENDSLGFRLWSLRNQKGIELEKAASDLKLSTDELKLIEQTDNAELGTTLVKDFANYYNVSVTYLLGYDDKLTVGDAIDILNAVSIGTIPPDDEIAKELIAKQKETVKRSQEIAQQAYEKYKDYDLVSNIKVFALLLENCDNIYTDIIRYVPPRLVKNELTEKELKSLNAFINLLEEHGKEFKDTADSFSKRLNADLKHTPTDND
ncbi:helix-turn-helix domain-containing protein [Streptococcus equinus]|uniref:helix-turn-helix domain-containing protein n=1 Tax=Streptococcus equinus TaxID=1335 RepID=UPI00088D56C5|nr:helix-turn-helix transcriptional regulator [Streptococcus equinus]QBX08062.1 DNA-binding protein [Streptococcus satellite phage Javan217]SDQ41749.1 DNA-binding transcriptional regulator, XRE-family HTH domain [Streptococcus equinus]